MKINRWIGIILGSLVIVLVAFVLFHIRRASHLMQRSVKIEPVMMDISNDSSALRIGEKWVRSLCVECHGTDLGGQTFFEDPLVGSLYAPNLTPGTGGIGYLNNEHWFGAIRHGISATGRPLVVMPSMEYTKMRKEDIGGIIAYLKTLPPIDRINKEPTFKPIAKFLLSAGAFGNLFGVDVINHQAPIPEDKKNEALVERGEYLTVITGCQSCHGAALNGKYTGDPSSPMAPNLTPSGSFSKWSYEDFTLLMKTGTTREGKEVNNRFMPWQAFSRLPEKELKAIYTYLKSLDPQEIQQNHLTLGWWPID